MDARKVYATECPSHSAPRSGISCGLSWRRRPISLAGKHANGRLFRRRIHRLAICVERLYGQPVELPVVRRRDAEQVLMPQRRRDFMVDGNELVLRLREIGAA